MTSPPIPAGNITAADLLGEVGAARRDIQAVMTKVEVMDARHTVTSAAVADHELRLRVVEGLVPSDLPSRIRALERWQWKAIGALAVVAIIVGIVSGYLGGLLEHAH